MKIQDQAILISKKNYGENSAIIKVLSAENGVFSGFARGVKSKNNLATFQIGNLVSFEWKSKTSDGLGTIFNVNLIKSYQSKIIFDAKKLTCFSSLLAIIDSFFLEREVEASLFTSVQEFFNYLAEEESNEESYLANYIKLEMEVLRVLGYEIDLSTCVVTNSAENLAFVSPKSARAVSFAIGKPYEDRLLKLPQFLVNPSSIFNKSHLLEGFLLSGYFLEKFLFNSIANSSSMKVRARVKELCF